MDHHYLNVVLQIDDLLNTFEFAKKTDQPGHHSYRLINFSYRTMHHLLWLTVVITNSVFAIEWEPSLSWYLYSKHIREPNSYLNQTTDNSTAIIEPSKMKVKGRPVLIRPGDFRPRKLPKIHAGELIHKSPTRSEGLTKVGTARLKRKDQRRVIWRGVRRVSGDVRLTPSSSDHRPIMGRNEGRSGRMEPDGMSSIMHSISLRALQRTTMATPLPLPNMLKKIVEIPVGVLPGEDF